MIFDFHIGSGSGFPMPGDNPVYEPAGNTTSELKGSSSPHTTTVVTALPVSEGGGPGGNDSSVEERRFDNLIYGDEDETDDGVYTTPFDQQDQPNHEFDNPIYGTETYDT